MAAQIKRCREPFATEIDGITRVIAAGELVSTDDPAYSRETRIHFEDVAVHVGQQAGRRASASGAVVEQATANPGEARTLTPPAPDPATTDDGELFDPGEHTAPEVIEYLKTADDEERARVLAVEAEGQKRKGVLALASQS
ncbi:hypothetical protein [Streptomyces sp. NPDC002265]|uniref:hypothetical protein n=1 Tax=Streptomyces sp. NPDC002265 TaxID=3154415 RepID=UPI003320E970